MIGPTLPPVPDEPNPRHLQQPDERTPYHAWGVYLGESDTETEAIAALYTVLLLEELMIEGCLGRYDD